jgi:hypothetical protein
MAIPWICFHIDLGIKLHSNTVNSIRVKQSKDARFTSVSLSSKVSFNIVRVFQILGLKSYWYLLLKSIMISIVKPILLNLVAKFKIMSMHQAGFRLEYILP